jgi:NAD(P)H-hydrate repair Nnr-like enzyme with NAD(P)H-hydrate epimerase domain
VKGDWKPKSARAGIGVALACAGLAIASCGGTVIDDGKAEDAIAADIGQHSKFKVSSVDCPSDVDVDPGTVFGCQVRLKDGRSGVYRLQIRDEDANVTFIGFKPAQK